MTDLQEIRVRAENQHEPGGKKIWNVLARDILYLLDRDVVVLTREEAGRVKEAIKEWQWDVAAQVNYCACGASFGAHEDVPSHEPGCDTAAVIALLEGGGS